MSFSRLTALMPCRELEELAQPRGGDDAEQILSAWSALWHPSLIGAARAMPRWAAAARPPEEPADHLFLLPPCSESLLPADWLAGAEKSSAGVLRHLRTRDEMVAAALGCLPPGTAPIEPDLVADFLALGYCHFTIEMLTQHLRYMSNLDEAAFERELLAGAEAACQGDVEAARGRLQAAFDLLHTAREYFYPVEAHLLDLTLVAPTTLGSAFRLALGGEPPANVLVSGQVLEEMALREPASLDVLRKSLEAGTAALIGGEFSELELPLLPPEAIRRQILRGLDAYERHLCQRPTVFGRRRFGITPVLPQILDKLGFVGALHATLDDGRFPAANQSRIRWEGIDGTVLETIVRVPSDASRADAFHGLPQYLGNSMDMDHVATIVFAHWPGRFSPWYLDLQRIARHTTVMGSFATVTNYFQQTGIAGQQTTYKADEYRSPYLKQAVDAGRRDPISRWVRYFARRAEAEAAETLDALASLATTTAPADSGLAAAIDDALAAETPDEAALDGRLRQELDRATERLAQAVTGPAPAGREGILLANPCSFSRRLTLEVPELAALPEVADPVQWAAESAGRRAVVVDVPALGYAWIGPGAGAAEPAPRRWGLFRRRPADPPPLAEINMPEAAASVGEPPPRPGATLRNEFVEIVLDPHTGALRSILDYRSRGPRLAQQIALRLPGAVGDEDDAYSIMAADEILVTVPGPVLGEVVVRGRLLDHSAQRLAGFRQTTRVWRGSRTIELEIELDVEELPGPDPWKSYYASRFAWADESASLYRSVNQASLPTDAVHLEAPHFIDIRSEKLRTTLLTGGLPYHRRFGGRKLDSLLIVRGETARRFRLGIGIDLSHPMAASLDFLSPRIVQPGRGRPRDASGWLFHLDARNVIATHWEPLLAEGRPVGFRARLLETDGRRVSLGLRSFRVPVAASKIVAADRQPAKLPIEGDRIAVDLGPYEWAEVETRFA